MNDNPYALHHRLSGDIATLIDVIGQHMRPFIKAVETAGRSFLTLYRFQVVMSSYTGYYQRRAMLQVKALPAPKEMP